MDLNDVSKDWFYPTGVFNLETRKGKVPTAQFCNQYLKDLEEKGIEIHYEMQYKDGGENNFIRLCCHSYPYGSFKNSKRNKNRYEHKLLNNYPKEKAEKIIEFRRAIRQDYIDIGKNNPIDGIEYYKKNIVDYLGLFWMRLPTKMSTAEAEAKFEWIRYETYETLVEKIEKYKNLL